MKKKNVIFFISIFLISFLLSSGAIYGNLAVNGYRDNGTIAYALTTSFINTAIALAIGYVFYRLIKTKGTPIKASEYGRNWTAWLVVISTTALLPKVIMQPNINTVFAWLVPLIVFSAITFVLGLVYGKFKVRKKSLNNPSVEAVKQPNTLLSNQTSDSGVNCSSCGAEITPKGAKFCKHCGAKVEQVITTSTTVKAEAIKPPTIEKKIVDEVKIDKPDDVAIHQETNKKIEKPLVHKDIKPSSKNNQARNTLILLSIFVIILIVVFSNTKKSTFSTAFDNIEAAHKAKLKNKQAQETEDSIDEFFQLKLSIGLINLRTPGLEYKNGKTKEYYERNGYTLIELDYYVGWSKNNELNGYGLIIFRDSLDIYEGELLNGRMHGQGVFNFGNGDRYEGEFEDGKEHGQGVYITVDGERYEGTWKHGKQQILN
jgi:phosphatidylglycerophosphate synthase